MNTNKKKYITDPEKLETIKSDCDSRETTLTKYAGENWSVFVADNTMLTKMKKLMNSCPEGYIKCWEGSRSSDGCITGYFFELNPRCVTFKSGKKTERNLKLTPEQKAERKAAFIARTQKARQLKKTNNN